jgi:hypothetical protein
MKTHKHLSHRTDTQIVSLHMENLIATFGEERVRAIVADMFVKRATKRAKKQMASNE